MRKSDGWQKKSAADIIAAFGSDKDSGLCGKDIKENRKKWGKNDLWYFGSPFMFLKNESIFSVLGYIILAISAFSASAFDICDDAVLIGITIIAGLLIYFSFEIIAGVICSGNCEKWIPKCTVIRNGKSICVRCDLLVPGDILIIKKGDTVSADVKLIYSDGITVKEPPFSKREGAVEKVAVGNAPAASDQFAPDDLIWAGSDILSGFGKAVVCATGTNSVLGSKGKIRLTPNAEPVHLALARKKGSSLGTVFMIFSFVAVALGVFSPLSRLDFVGLFLVFLSFAVSVGGEIYPSVCCIMYSLAMVRSKDHGITVRDAIGADFLMNCRGVAAESSAIMKSGDVNLRMIYANGNTVETGNSEGDELFALLYTGIDHINGKYRKEIIGALKEHVSQNSDFDRFVSGVQTTKPVVDYLSAGQIQYSLYVSGGEHYFTMTGSIDDTIRHCAMIRVNGRDVPLDKERLKSVLNAASEASKNATYLIAVAVRKSPYNTLKRLSVLSADLTFAGFVAVDTPADPGLMRELAYLKRENLPFFFFSDGSGEDVNFARRTGIINNRSELVSADDPAGAVEYMFAEHSNGGVIESSCDEKVKAVLEVAHTRGKRLLCIGHPDEMQGCGFFAAIGDPGYGSGATINAKGKAEVSAMLAALYLVRNLRRRFSTVQKYILISSLLRAVYAVTSVFGMPYVYPSAILIWGIVVDMAVSILILSIKSKSRAV